MRIASVFMRYFSAKTSRSYYKPKTLTAATLIEIDRDEALLNTLAFTEYHPISSVESSHYEYSLKNSLAEAYAKFLRFKRDPKPQTGGIDYSLASIDYGILYIMDILEEKTALSVPVKKEALNCLKSIKSFLEKELSPKDFESKFCQSLIRKINKLIKENPLMLAKERNEPPFELV